MKFKECYDILVVIVNYNSSKIIGIERLLLKGIKELSHSRRVKLLLIDNNSVDTSPRLLTEYASSLSIDYKLLVLSRNYGFARAVNIGYKYAYKKYCFRYFMLVNNDAVIVPENTLKIIEYLEYDNIGGVQGTIMQAYNPGIIDNTGFLIDSLGLSYPVCRGFPVECSRMYFPSYLSGAHSIYKRELLDKIGGPFSNYFEGYFDDRYLGLLSWSKGYKLLHVPVVTTYHVGSFSFSGINKVFKSPKWFKNIMLADLVSSSLVSGSKGTTLTLYMYLLVASMASLIRGKNYVKPVIQAYKEYKMFKQSNEYLKLASIVNGAVGPRINKTVPWRNHLKGIKINRD